MVNYENGLVYKIACRETGEVYIGSTTQSITTRINKHKADVNCFDKGTKNNRCTSYNIIKRGNYEVSILETFPTTAKLFLQQRERYFIENETSVVNEVVPRRSKAESNKAYKEVHVLRD